MGKKLILFCFLVCFFLMSTSSRIQSQEVIEFIRPGSQDQNKTYSTILNTDKEESESVNWQSHLKNNLPLQESHVFSFGRIQFETIDYYSRFIGSRVLFQEFLNHLIRTTDFFDDFNLLKLLDRKKVTSDYNPFALSLMYKGVEYPPVYDYPSMFDTTQLDKYQNFLKHPAGADTLLRVNESSPGIDIMNKFLVEYPYFTEEIWDSIPDPPKISFGEGWIEKRSAHDEISRLLNYEDLNTRRVMEKRTGVVRRWTYGGTENIQFSQAYLENWAKGGENAITLLSDLRVNAKYKIDNVEWESYAIHKLGILSSEERKTRVNDDLIELNTKYGLSASKKWYYSGLFNFKTQFFNGYNKNDTEKETPISGFLAPAYLTMALGMDYKEKNFTLMLLPFTSKLTYVADTAKFDQTKYNIPADKKSDNMGGASVVNNFKWAFAKDFNLASKFDFFYEYMGRDNQIQGEWELILDMKINIFLSTRIGTYLRYYSNESDKIQFKENLSIAFSYRF
ncbi:DUF3078 domain-containing protein [Thermophagus sp. OGC60D27]|uniref:DUF3078 domain-containing protein n=1 Tax=Thermophagus sp. OGC60D27 TaxID=3458415 RepID=UPI004037BDB1